MELGGYFVKGIWWSLALSPSRSIYRYDFDGATAALSNQRLLVRTEKGCFPDGATVDAEGYIWSAQWAASRADLVFVAGEHPALHPGQTAAICYQGKTVGYVGTIHPLLQKKMGFAQPIYLFEVELSAITSAELPKFTELSKFPEVRRDLAILLERGIEANSVLNAVREVAGDELRNLRLFDIYEGKGIDLKEKSLALGLTYQHSSRTLNEDEVNASVERVVSQLQQRFGATLR